MNHYRIEKVRIPVVLSLVSGGELAGDVFAQPYSQQRLGPEEVADVLNSDEPFLPLGTADGQAVLVAKEQIASAAAQRQSDPDEAWQALLTPQGVAVTLVTGACIEGTLYLEVPAERPRLLDFLNYHDERFVTLFVDDGIRLVNIHHVAHVRPLD